MKCPNCGAQMKEGRLYCEKCGTEVQIVPDFEPELENSIHTTLSNVATEITEPPVEPPKKTERKKRWFWLLPAALLGLIAGIVIALHYVPGYQYNRGVACLERQQYQEAEKRLLRAVSLSPNNVSYLNRLSGCYYLMGEWEKAKEVCLKTIELEGSNEEAYRRLVLLYEKNKDYEAINTLIQSCSDREIRSRYGDYLADPPTFDPAGGLYYQKQNVKLIGNAAGTVYYTLDGATPTEESDVYTAPVAMESGSHVLKAFFVNAYGVKSDVVTENYYIDVTVPTAPTVTPASGEYAYPTQIEVDLPEEGTVYYTTDGSQPDANSQVYENPIWMPVGYSTFRFVVVSPGGITGEETKMQYTLNLHPVLNTEAAQNRLLLNLKDAGILSDIQGSIEGKNGQNRYLYRYPLTVNENHYYLYREYYEEADGSTTATPNRYVVNYISGECYRIEQQPDGTYKLYHIDPKEKTDETTPESRSGNNP